MVDYLVLAPSLHSYNIFIDNYICDLAPYDSVIYRTESLIVLGSSRTFKYISSYRDILGLSDCDLMLIDNWFDNPYYNEDFYSSLIYVLNEDYRIYLLNVLEKRRCQLHSM